MGMTEALSSNANFKGLCAQPADGKSLYIGDVLQKAVIAMQEEGVEAAAATAMIMEGYSAPLPTTPVAMKVNRPYVISIVDVPTGALLFLWHIVDPTAAGDK